MIAERAAGRKAAAVAAMMAAARAEARRAREEAAGIVRGARGAGRPDYGPERRRPDRASGVLAFQDTGVPSQAPLLAGAASSSSRRRRIRWARANCKGRA